MDALEETAVGDPPATAAACACSKCCSALGTVVVAAGGLSKLRAMDFTLRASVHQSVLYLVLRHESHRLCFAPDAIAVSVLVAALTPGGCR